MIYEMKQKYFQLCIAATLLSADEEIMLELIFWLALFAFIACAPCCVLVRLALNE